ncbi:MAG TPA: glycosyl transferase family 1 [Methylophilaceae bacterium]|nr:glycosyl transferase family 1 [Methylophilaceae bacterium]
MKILLISDVYFPRVNGVSTSIKTFTEQMQQLGHKVHLIAPDYGVPSSDEAWITRVPARSIYFDPEDKLMKYREILKLTPKLKGANYDILHIHTPFVAHYAGLKLAKALKIPTVETYHTFFEDYLHHYLGWIPKSMARGIARMISKSQCNQVYGLVSPSQPMLDVLYSYGVNTSSEVIPTGLQQNSFVEVDGLAFRERYGIPANRPMLLYVGRVAYEKNIGFLLEVVRLLIDEIPDILFLITGEGPAEESLKHHVNHLGLQKHVQFVGYLDRTTELNACYKAADIFVFASKSETQGLVLLEAMAQGTPIVAIAELGTASVLVEGLGAKIAAESELDFVEKIHSLLINKEHRVALGLRGKEYALQQWSSAAQAEKMLALYARLIVRFHENIEKQLIGLESQQT